MDDPLRPERRPVASTAPVEADRREEPSGWLPCYAWWPRPEDYSVTVVLTPYHATVDPEAEFRFVLRGYAGSPTPEWEREAGRVRFGEQRAVRLDDLELPDPPEHGGVLEVHAIRLDAAPPKGTKFLGMWVDAHGRRGGGYLAPTVPIQGAAKLLARDDLQVVPGIVASRELESEVVLLNPTRSGTSARLVVTSPDGLSAEGAPFDVAPWSAWHGVLSAEVPRVRRLLEPSGGVGSLSIYSGQRLLPFFGMRLTEGPLTSMDHTAPIFA